MAGVKVRDRVRAGVEVGAVVDRGIDFDSYWSC